ncbi:MAG TPA: class I SAM-dependent methyltransferase [Polyangiaceae bacterium]|nr:class I SAM-dependent methyltransferase [Polyangiaceae bacterium]
MLPTAVTPKAAPPLTPPANFSRFARLYAPIEWLSFGRALTRRRECFLSHPRVAGACRVLILGDGDGRFTAALLERNPSAEITAVDVSAAMLSQLERRVRARTPNARLDLQQVDIRSWPVPPANYDLVVAHFFFDCFTTDDLATVIARISPALAPNALWLLSDFAIPTHPIWTPFAKALLRLLYLTIGSLTGLKHRHLPDHQIALNSAHFELANVDTAFGGTLRSEIWQRAPTPQLPSTAP